MRSGEPLGAGGGRPAAARAGAAPQAKFPAAVTALTAPGFPAGTAPGCRRTGETGRGSGTSCRSTSRGAGAAAEQVNPAEGGGAAGSPPARGVPGRGPWQSRRPLPARCRGAGNAKESWQSPRELPFEVEAWPLVSPELRSRDSVVTFRRFTKAAALLVSVEQEEGRGCVGNEGIKSYKDCVPTMTSLWLDVGNLQSSDAGCSLIAVDFLTPRFPVM